MLRFLKTLAPPALDRGRTSEAVASTDEATADEARPQRTDPAEGRAWSCAVGPGGRYVGLAAGARLEIWDVTLSEASVVRRVELPAAAHTGRIAVHPTGDAVAFAAQSTIWSIRRDGTGFPAPLASAWGEPRALCFDPAGTVLWASSANDEQAHVCALDWQMIALIGAQPCAGLPGLDHALSFHPSGAPGVLMRADAERGTALCLLERTEVALDVAELDLAAAGEPFFFAGFAPDGGRVATVFRGRVEQHDWATRETRGSVTLDEGHSFYMAGCFCGDELVLLAHEQQAAADRLVVLDRDLRMRTFLQWKPEDQQQLIGVHALAGSKVLVVGDRRVGLFELGADPPAE